jgi:hypothetical protein
MQNMFYRPLVSACFVAVTACSKVVTRTCTKQQDSICRENLVGSIKTILSIVCLTVMQPVVQTLLRGVWQTGNNWCLKQPVGDKVVAVHLGANVEGAIILSDERTSVHKKQL